MVFSHVCPFEGSLNDYCISNIGDLQLRKKKSLIELSGIQVEFQCITNGKSLNIII